MPEDWYSYRSVNFADRDCMLWIAKNIHTLEAGRWPDPPPGCRMSDGPIGTPEPKHKAKNRHYEPMRGREASFCKPAGIAGDFKRRVDMVRGNQRADAHRIMFEEHYYNGVDILRLAKLASLPPWKCEKAIGKVMKFITGKRPKQIDGRLATYAEWCNHRKQGKSGNLKRNLTGIASCDSL